MQNHSENSILVKSYEIELRIIEVYQYLRDINKEFDLSRQILICGTSIVANVKAFLKITGSIIKTFKTQSSHAISFS